MSRGERRAVDRERLLQVRLGVGIAAELVQRPADRVAHAGFDQRLVRERALVELGDSGPTEALRTLVESALEKNEAVLAQSEEQSRQLWRIRESIPEAQFTNVKHDISVPVSRVPELIERAGAALQASFPGEPVYAFGHIGDGNIHYNVGGPALVARRAEVNQVVYGVLDALGGSISAEHGLGQLKREEIRRHKDPLELELMRALKRALDPQGLMNPGKLL